MFSCFKFCIKEEEEPEVARRPEGEKTKKRSLLQALKERLRRTVQRRKKHDGRNESSEESLSRNFFVRTEKVSEGPVSVTVSKELLEGLEEASRAFGPECNWKKVKALGSGFFGTVYLFKNVETKEVVARKVIDVYTIIDAIKEEVLQSQLEHVNVLTLFFWRQEGRRHSLFLEYVTGGRLEDKIKDIAQEESLVYFEQLKKGVDYLHTKGIAHRDLKPDNLLLTQENVLKIADFGSADVFLFEGQEVRMTGIVGSVPYTAPEIFQGPRYLGPPVDLWASGLILYKMLTRTLPWALAAASDEKYSLWTRWNEREKNFPKWGELREPLKLLLENLLAPRPQDRLSGWREYRHE